MKNLKVTLAVILALFVAVIIAHTVTLFAIEFINLLNDKV